MKHKPLYSLTNTELDSKFSTIESLLTENGTLNATLVRYKILYKLSIYKNILDQTKQLDDMFGNICDGERIQFIRKDARIEHCNICGAPYIYFPCSQRRLTTCKHKQRYDEKSSSKAKEKHMQNIQEFYRSLQDATLQLNFDDFNCKLNELAQKQANYAFSAFTSDKKFYHDLIVKTKQVLPINKLDLQIGHRIYLASHDIYTQDAVPRCKYCGKMSSFKNRIIGYSDSCVKCSQLKNNDTRIANIKQKIDSLIDTLKYEVIHYPQLVNKDILIIKCKKCNKESSLYIHNGRIKSLKDGNLCKHCEIPVGSKDEEEILQFIKSFYKGKIIHGQNSRKIIAPYELDFYFPEHRIAIEYNGIYWHSLAVHEKDTHLRHQLKTNLCQVKNIQLVQLFDDEWHQKKDVCKLFIKNLLGCCMPVFAVKQDISASTCRVAQISNESAMQFHSHNNILGSVKANQNYGLFIAQKLIAVASFKKVKNTYDYEIARFSYDLAYEFNNIFLTVIAQQFAKDIKLNRILYYHDRRFPIIKADDTYHMTLLRRLPNKFWYCESHVRFNRNMKKRDLVTLANARLRLKRIDTSNLSADEILEKAGIRKTYDCGTDVYAIYVCQK